MQDPAHVLKIKEVREKKNLSQDEVVKRTGIPKRSYVNYENGITDVPFSKLQNIANALEVGVPDLIASEGDFSTNQKAKEDNTSYPDLMDIRNEIRGDLKTISNGMIENFRVLNDGVFHLLKDNQQLLKGNQKVLKFIDHAEETKFFDIAKGLGEFLKAKK